MALMEVVIITTGHAIAKAVLKLWLGDSTIALDVSSSLVDLLQAKTSDIFARRQAERQFEDIGEKVAKNLMPYFQRESRLDESSATAVALAVAETFDRTPLTAEHIVVNNLEPGLLADYLLKHAPRSNELFSDAEHRLYQRCVRESCRYIVEISSRLPSFSERAFGQILSRQSQLLSAVDVVIQELRGIREYIEEADIEAENAYFEAEYRTAVRRLLNRVYLFGVDISELSRQQNLSVAYVTLSAKPKSIQSQHSQQKPGSLEAQELSTDRLLKGAKRLLITGRAGSGKTTLLKWIAVQAALQRFQAELSDLNTKVPFFIRLRKFSEQHLPSPDRFPGLLSAYMDANMPQNWAKEQLRTGRAILLVDGIDEVSDTQHQQVRDWLDELLTVYPEVICILSSRPHAVNSETWGSWLQRRRFKVAELQPMDFPSIRDFITNWHDAVASELIEPDSRAELTLQENRLLDTVQQNFAIRNIATSPLLCAMICALHRERHHLPSDRIELYQSCTKMLLYERERERDISLKEYPRLSYRQQTSFLKAIAYWLQKNGKSEVEQSRVESRIAHALKSMPDLRDNIEPRDVLRLLKDRSGILVEPTVATVAFTHQTFQEYFAAQAIVEEEDDIGLLVNRAHDRQWRETIILTAGLAKPSQRREIIHGIVARGDEELELRHYLHLLAISCLEIVTELAPELEALLNTRLEQLVPPRSLSEATDLASAGKLVLPFLHYSSATLDEVAAACVRTIVLIGGPAALDVLEEYATDTRVAVIAELVRGFDSFEHDDYARRVLAPGQHRSLALTTSSLSGLQHLPTLHELDLTKCRRLSDLSPLVSLTNLIRLDLSGLDLTGVDPRFLSQLGRLTALSLARVRWGTESHNKDPMSALQPGVIGGTPVDIQFIGDLVELSELDLSGVNLAKMNLEVLKSLKNLKTLVFSEAQLHHTDMSGLRAWDADFEGAVLDRADLSDSNLPYARFDGASLEWVNLSGANLYGATFRGANLQHANLVEANIANTDLTGAQLGGADLTGARLDGAITVDVEIGEDTTLPDAYLAPQEPDIDEWWDYSSLDN